MLRNDNENLSRNEFFLLRKVELSPLPRLIKFSVFLLMRLSTRIIFDASCWFPMLVQCFRFEYSIDSTDTYIHIYTFSLFKVWILRWLSDVHTVYSSIIIQHLVKGIKSRIILSYILCIERERERMEARLNNQRKVMRDMEGQRFRFNRPSSQKSSIERCSLGNRKEIQPGRNSAC